MITVTQDLNSDIIADVVLPYDINDIALFDIETTGLSPAKHMIYMIGILTYDGESFTCTQYLLTNLEDEKDMLVQFFKQINDKSYLIHFNGSTFDIPFINKRADFHNINSILKKLDTVNSIDLYKTYRKYSKLLNFDNYKLTTIEKKLNIYRKDSYSGKELIKTYMDFVKYYSLDVLKKDFSKSTPLKEYLLLHNYEDIINLVPLLKIEHLDYIKKGYIDINVEPYITSNKLIINGSLKKDNIPYSVPHTIDTLYCSEQSSLIDDTIHVIINNDSVTIEATIIEDELKYFYSDYKNYYYLPLEDTALHKSIGAYVDKEHRIQAKASNCYIKKSSSYVKTASPTICDTLFKLDFSNPNLYLDIDTLLKKVSLTDYVRTIIDAIINQK